MLSGFDVPRHPDWWLVRLSRKLFARRTELDVLEARAQGMPPTPPEYQETEGMSEAYQSFITRAHTNLVGLVSAAVQDRMHVLGFRTGAAPDETGDDLAWSYWQANDMDYWSTLLWGAALNMRDGYTMVSQPGADGTPRVTVEDPRQVITEEDPTTGATIAALKVWYDDIDEFDRAMLNLPGGVVVHYRSERKVRRFHTNGMTGQTSPNPNAWTVDEHRSGSVPMGDVLVVRFPNRRNLLGQTMAEFEDVVPIQDRIDRNTFDRMLIAATQAFKQRHVSGDIPTSDRNGNEVDLNKLLKSGPDALWALTGEVNFGEFSQTDLTPLLKANEADIMEMAKVSRTPAQHLLGGDLVNVGADAYTASMDPFLAKCRQRNDQFASPIERTMSLMFASIGDTLRASLPDMQVIWRNPQRYTLSESMDAAAKAKQAEVMARRTIQRDILQMTPQEIRRDEADRAADELDNALNSPQGSVNGGGVANSGVAGGQASGGAGQPAAAGAEPDVAEAVGAAGQ